MIPFKTHIKSIKRIKEPSTDSKILRLHKRERDYPFSDQLNFLIKDLNHSFSNYPDLDDTYEIVASKYDVDKSNLILTAGCDLALRLFYEASDLKSIILPSSCYAMNFVYKNIYHPRAKILHFDFNNKGLPSLSNLIKVIDSVEDKNKTVLILENPSGFTGQSFDESLFIEILRYTSKNQICLIIDETYLETRKFNWTAKKYRDSENLIIVSSFSKAYGMAGIRAGFLISNKDNIDNLKKLLPMHEITSYTSEILKIAISDNSLFKYRDQICSDEKSFMENKLIMNSFDLKETDTNFILFRNKIKSCYELQHFLINQNIQIKVNKDDPHFYQWCSASIGSQENTKILMNKLINFSSKT